MVPVELRPPGGRRFSPASREVARCELVPELRIAPAKLSSKVPVFAMIFIDYLHIGKHQLCPAIGIIWRTKSRIQFELLIDKR